MKALAEAPREAPESFAALAVALPKEWHQAVLGLACQTDHIVDILQKMQGPTRQYGGVVNIVRATVTELIDWLDEWGYLDSELEDPGDLEPSLGWTISGVGLAFAGSEPDREQDEADDEDGGDNEPSLGSLAHDDQTRWGDSPRRDLEEQCEDEGAHA